MDFQKKVCDGIVKWLREQAPEVVRKEMSQRHVRVLAQEIADQFTEEDARRLDPD